MTPRFILDENVVILAQQGLDEEGNPNPVCAELVQQIIEICHTIVVDDVLWNKFDEQLNRPVTNFPKPAPTYSVFFGMRLRLPTRWTAWVTPRLPSTKKGPSCPAA